MERNPLIAPQVPSNDEAQVHALTEDYYSRVGNEPGSGGGKGWDPQDLPVRCAARGRGVAAGTSRQTTASHLQFYHPLPFQQRGPVLIGEDAHVARPPLGPRDRPEEQDQGCQGNQETPQLRHVSRSHQPPRARPLLLPTAAPLPLWRPLRSCAQGACEARRPSQRFNAHARARVSAGGGGKGGKGGACVQPGAQD